MIPMYLIPYVDAVIKEGHTDPLKILKLAIDRNNAVCQEMIEQKTPRSKLMMQNLSKDIWETIREENANVK